MVRWNSKLSLAIASASDIIEQRRISRTERISAMGEQGLCFCGSGKPHEECHNGIANNSIIAHLIAKYRELDISLESAKNACREGCCECCSFYFDISEIEYFALRYHLERTGKLKYYERKAIINMEQMRNEHKEAHSFLTKPLSSSDSADGFFANSHLMPDKYLPCIFLEHGRCSVYEYRPICCRTYGWSIDTKNDNSKDCLQCEYIDPAQCVTSDNITHYDDVFYFLVNRYLPGHKNNKHIVQRLYPIYYWFSENRRYAKRYSKAKILGIEDFVREVILGI